MLSPCFRKLCLLVVSVCAADAQSVTPKTITFNGAPQYAQADLLAVSGMTPGKPVTSAEIEAAMHRLDDTGLFADMRFGVTNDALRV